MKKPSWTFKCDSGGKVDRMLSGLTRKERDQLINESLAVYREKQKKAKAAAK